MTIDHHAEKNISEFYSKIGWESEFGITEDAKRFEDLRKSARDYVSQCRLRVLRHIPKSGDNLLDLGSGPIQYPEYLEYSRNFKKRYCIDLSSSALESAKEKIGEHGVFMHGSFFDLELEENFFDCTISLHTIYHIDKDQQEEAVRKLIRLTKPGHPIIIVYGNPGALTRIPLFFFKVLRRLFLRGKNLDGDQPLYYHTHPLTWWRQFEDDGEIKIFPWRSFKSDHQKLLFPDNKFGEFLFSILFRLEECLPGIFAKFFEYPMIVIRKR